MLILSLPHNPTTMVVDRALLARIVALARENDLVPAGLVAFMRRRLGWDVFFVMEDEEMRRASVLEHLRLARRLHRTLVTLDRRALATYALVGADVELVAE